ncbi:MAG: FAD-dependent monooxygenase [Candidatus Velthaea sp.]
MAILIAGGGIGGLAAALFLRRAGLHDVAVFEQAPELREIGAGIQVAPNAVRLLRRLGLADAIEPDAVFPERITWMNALSGERVTWLDLGPPFRRRYGYRYIVMHRSDLLAVLVAACRRDARISLRNNKELISIAESGEAVTVTCADGSHESGEALVGADGLWSTVRRYVSDDGGPECSEYVAYRGAIPIEQMSEHAGLDNVVVWTGPDMHLVQYPLRRGELYNQVAVFKSYRYRPDSDDWGTTDELEERFGTATGAVRNALRMIKRNRRWPMYDRPPRPEWARGRAVLLGDAAHPMLQYLAQGACQAIEDAVALGAAFAEHSGVDAAFAAYKSARVLRTARVQSMARDWGRFWHVHGEAMTRRDALLATRAPDDYRDTDWFYGA